VLTCMTSDTASPNTAFSCRSMPIFNVALQHMTEQQDRTAEHSTL
jgi:hypothetical protein